MSIQQISVFLENRAGQLAELTQLLADNLVDIRAISIAETTDYGLARMIVDDCERTSKVLRDSGAVMSVTPVWAVEVPDKPAGLATLLSVLSQNEISVAYMYSLFTHRDDTAYMVLRVEDEEKFIAAMKKSGMKIMTADQLGLK